MKKVVNGSLLLLFALAFVASSASAQSFDGVTLGSGVTDFKFSGFDAYASVGVAVDPATVLIKVGSNFIPGPTFVDLGADGKITVTIENPASGLVTVTINDFDAGTSAVGTYDFTPAGGSATPTTTTLAISPAAPHYYGASVTFTATVDPNPYPGNVRFDGVEALPVTVAVSASGVASYTTSETYAVGFHGGITATFVGTTGFATSVSSPPASVTVDPAKLTVDVTASNKTYDGNTSVTLVFGSTPLVGIVNGEDVSISPGYSASFADKTAGSNKPVNLSVLTLTGASAANYTLTQPTLHATILPKNLTISGVTAADKVYDGNQVANLVTSSAALSGAISGDDISLNSAGATGTFADKNVGNGKSVSASGFALAGSDVGNYTLSQPTGLAANITTATATVTAFAALKTYGTPDPSFSGALGGFVPADGITATFARTPGETVAGSPYTISGTLSPAAALSNYSIVYNSATFTINRAGASVTPANASKVFGAPDPVLTGTLTGFLGTDNVTATYTRAPGESVSGSPYIISATLSPAGVLDNYNIAYGTAEFTITTNATATALASSSNPSAYGQSVTFTATVTSVGGTPTGSVNFNDGATLLGAGTLNGSGVATFSTSSLSASGSPHAITATYAGDANFAGSVSATLSQAVTPKTLTVTGITANDKVYDGTTTATLNTSAAALVGVVGSDNVTLNTSSAAGTFASAQVGTGITVTVSGLTLGGTAAANYTLTQPTTTANITAPASERGLVAGAGYISSSAGSYPTKPSFTGKGYFVILASTLNQSSTPSGGTVFLLKSAGLFSKTEFTFSSASYDGMDISGAQAKYQGTGKVNGKGTYGFFVSTLDGRLSGTHADKLRIKIWDLAHSNAVFYDSQMNDADDAVPTSTVSGGVLQLSKSASSATATPQLSIEEVVKEDEATTIPTAFTVYDAYPNPFNPATTIAFDLPEPTNVRLAVYDMLGREVAVLVNETRSAGHHAVVFNASNLSSGIYVYRFQAGNYVQTKKLMLMK